MPRLRQDDERGSALVEFAIVLPLLVVFVVGIYDFSGAFNQKQKVAQAAQEGAILAAAQPTNDVTNTAAPDSLTPVVAAVFNSLTGSGVLSGSSCSAPVASRAGLPQLAWKYTISGCAGSTGDVVITINRGVGTTASTPAAVGSTVTVSYPYNWQFNSVIQVLIPGANYAKTTQVTETAWVHNQS